MDARFAQKGQRHLEQSLRRGTAVVRVGVRVRIEPGAVPEIHELLVARWCRERVPARARDQVRMEYQVRGGSVTLLERRAPWRPDLGPEWTSRPIAQLRYAPNEWRLLARPQRPLAPGRSRSARREPRRPIGRRGGPGQRVRVTHSRSRRRIPRALRYSAVNIRLQRSDRREMRCPRADLFLS